MVLDRNVNIITDLKGNKIVLINDIVFKGKRSVNWDDVKITLKPMSVNFMKLPIHTILCILEKSYQMNTLVRGIHIR